VLWRNMSCPIAINQEWQKLKTWPRIQSSDAKVPSDKRSKNVDSDNNGLHCLKSITQRLLGGFCQKERHESDNYTTVHGITL